MMLLAFLSVLIILGTPSALGYEQIPITFSGTRDMVIFDGKWSFEREWKESSLNEFSYDGNKLVILRSAHQDNYVYLLIDVVNDESIDVGEDKAAVCFDTNNDKNPIPDADDFCFMAVLGDSQGLTFRGNSTNQDGEYFSQIDNPDGYIGVGSVSDENDRYSGVPHTGYEFRIPTDTVGRNNLYGFHFSVFDAHSQKFYAYPGDINAMFATPDKWGDIYSPDKSLPEFYLPLLMLFPALMAVVVLTRKNNLKS